jgi:hypothetical protein
VLDRGVELLLQHETLDEAALVELSRDTSPMRAPVSTAWSSPDAAGTVATTAEPALSVETLRKMPAVAA